MARGRPRSSFRDKVAKNSQQQRTKASSYGHLLLPRGVNMFKEEPGSRVSLDFLPYRVTDARHPDRDEEDGTAVEGSLWYRRPYRLHRSVGTDNVSVVCPTSFGGKCPICEYRARMLAEGSKWNDKVVKGLKPSDRDLYYVVPKGVKSFEEKPHIWDISQFLFQAKLNDELEENDEHGVFPDLEEGLTLKIRFSEKDFVSDDGAKNKFAETSRIDFAERDYAYEEKTVDGLTSLDDVLDVKSYREIERIFLDQDEAGEDDDEKEPGPAATTRPRRSARPQAESEEDEATPPRQSRRAAPEPEPEEDPDDDNDDDDDDDDADTKEPEVVPAETRKPARRASEPQDSKKPARRADPEPAPRERSRRTPAADKKSDDDCPHGHRFGRDNDKHEECDECAVWAACADTQEKAQAKARA